MGCFVSLFVVVSTTAIDYLGSLRNDLLCVEWDVKPTHSLTTCRFLGAGAFYIIYHIIGWYFWYFSWI